MSLRFQLQFRSLKKGGIFFFLEVLCGNAVLWKDFCFFFHTKMGEAEAFFQSTSFESTNDWLFFSNSKKNQDFECHPLHLVLGLFFEKPLKMLTWPNQKTIEVWWLDWRKKPWFNSHRKRWPAFLLFHVFVGCSKNRLLLSLGISFVCPRLCYLLHVLSWWLVRVNLTFVRFVLQVLAWYCFRVDDFFLQLEWFPTRGKCHKGRGFNKTYEFGVDGLKPVKTQRFFLSQNPAGRVTSILVIWRLHPAAAWRLEIVDMNHQ